MEKNGRLLDLDIRGLIGLLAVVGLFGIVFIQLTTSKVVAIPPEVAGVVGSVVGFYFGSKGSNGASTEQAVQGVKLDMVHDLVNSRFNDLVRVNAQQTQQIHDAALEKAHEE